MTGTVTGDVAIGAGSAQLLAPVHGDVRAISGNVSVNDIVDGDLVAFAGKVHVLGDGVVAGDLYVAGGQVTVDGTVRGSVTVAGGRLVVNGTVLGSVTARVSDALVVGPGATVGGGMEYHSPREAEIDSTARVSGPVVHTPVKRAERDGSAAAAIGLGVLGVLTAMKTLAFVGLAALLMWRWRRQVLEVLQDVHDRFLPSLGHGVVYLIMVPVAGILLLVSFIGTLPGVLLLMLYGALGILAKVMAGMFIGASLWRVMRKGTVLHLEWTSAIVGVVVLELIGLIPFIGWLVKWVVCVAVFGALASRTRKML